MPEISEDRLKRFWKWCGLTYKTSRSTEYWYGPKGESIVSALGNGGRVLFTLGNLVKYAVPKVKSMDMDLTIMIDSIPQKQPLVEITHTHGDPDVVCSSGEDDDLTTALFLAIEPLMWAN